LLDLINEVLVTMVKTILPSVLWTVKHNNALKIQKKTKTKKETITTLGMIAVEANGKLTS